MEKEEIKADAKNRSVRTLIQGAAIVAIMVVVTVVGNFMDANITAENVFTLEAYVGLPNAVVVAVGTAVLSYFQRRIEG